MDSILHYTSVSHAGSLMQGVNQMRVCSDFCDVTVVVGDYRILAHKIILSASSPYFCQMLKLDTKSKTSKFNEIFLDNVDEIAALKIIEFCYTSAISLDDNTVWPLLEAAIKFQLQEICSLCCEFLTAGLDVSNCVLSLRLAARLHFPQLEENCVRFVVDNLQKASKSSELISLSPQELSTVLSVVAIHGNHSQVIATLTQAWLNWDRKSRIDFVPMLKLLLPKLGDHFQHLLDKNSNAPGQDSSDSSAFVENGAKTHLRDGVEAKSQVDPDSSLDSKSDSSSSSSLKSPQSASLPDSNGNAKETSDNIFISPVASENKEALSKGKDFICISCGDEFECKNDLSAHCRLCDESVNKIKNVGEQNMSPLPEGSHQNKSNETSQSDLQEDVRDDCQNTNLVNTSKSYDIKIDEAEDNKSGPSERTYPKLRRSPRGHKPDSNIEDEKKPSSHPNVHSFHTSDESSKDESGSLYNPDYHMKQNIGPSELEEDGDKSGTVNGGLLEKTVLDVPTNVAKASTVSRHDINCININEASWEQTMNTDDNNNNDAVDQDSQTTLQSMDSDSKNEINHVPSDKVDQAVGTHNSPGDKATVKDENVQDREGSFTLKQWREEHHNPAAIDRLIDSTPIHKCLICSRGFWERKALTNHWRQDHGVRAFGDEEEDNSSSDHDVNHSSSKVSKRKCLSPKHAYPSYKQVPNDVISDIQMNADKSKQGKSFNSQLKFDLNKNVPSDQMEKSCSNLLQVKEEIKDERSYPASAESMGKNCGKNMNLYHHYLSGHEQSQAALKPHENINLELGHPLNPSFENPMRNPFWPQENNEPGQHPSASAKPAQNMDQTANDFLTSYINYYNKLAEGFMAQGTQYCPLCLGYHPVGKACPKAVAHNGSLDAPSANNQNDKGDNGSKDKEAVLKEPIKKADEDVEEPLDMSKSALNFSGGLLTPSSSSSSKSSSLNSSGIGMLPFLNYGQFMSDTDALDMSTPRYGDSKSTPHPQGDIPVSLRKSPLQPDTSFGNTFPSYPLQFSTAPPLSTPTAGPSTSTSNAIASLPPFLKSPSLTKKKVPSRQGFPCTVCNRVFSYQTALFTHMHTHSPSARSYRCQLCNETFARAPDLKVHVCPNGMEKPYSCPSCGQTFAKNIHLKRHLATHSGLKPYPCWVCGKRFSRSDHLKRHTQSIHAGARPHVCQVCGKEFVRKYELNKHMQSHEQTFPVP